MRYEVVSSRLEWGPGTVLGAKQLAGCNITALVQGGHIVPVTERKRTPNPAQEPKEQD